MLKINKRNKWALSTGCVGRDMCYTLVSLFLLTYIQYTGLLNDAQFGVLTVIIVLCRIWDAFNDPMMGTIISNTKSKFGKYRPWVLIGAILNSIIMILMFSIRLDNGWGNVAFLGITYLFWGMTFTMNDISYWGLLPALTDDKKDRDSLTTLVAVFASVGAFAIGGLVPMLTAGNMIVAYRNFAIVCAIIFMICQISVFFLVHDNKKDAFIDPNYKNESMEQVEEKITLKKMLKILANNKQLLVMAVVVFLYSLGSALLNAFGQNFFYFKFSYGGNEMFIFTVIYAVGTLISQALYPVFAKKFLRKDLIRVSTILLIIGYLAFFAFANIPLSNLNITFIILCVLGVFIFVGQGVFYLTMLVMLTNTIEYGEWKSGRKDSAIVFSVRPFMVKLAGAFQYLVVAVTLLMCKLTDITNKVGELEVEIGKGEAVYSKEQIEAFKTQAAEAMTHASSGQILGLTLAMTVIPVIMFIVAYIVSRKKYIIDEQMYDKMLKEIALRNNNEQEIEK